MGFSSAARVLPRETVIRRPVTYVVSYVLGFRSVAGVVTRVSGFRKPFTDVVAHVLEFSTAVPRDTSVPRKSMIIN